MASPSRFVFLSTPIRLPPSLNQSCPSQSGNTFFRLFLSVSERYAFSPKPVRVLSNLHEESKQRNPDLRVSYRFSNDDFFEEHSGDCRFDRAVLLFNDRDYHECHDCLEPIWNKSEEPRRTLIHGILQCAVGFHHLFNQNHRGAMMELGEGLCKLRKMNFDSGPFLQFEREISGTLDFIYQTQLELAACTEDFCLAMDGSERSYQLLGSFAAGQHLYSLERHPDGVLYIVFSPEGSSSSDKPARVKVPTLHATEEHLKACEYN